MKRKMEERDVKVKRENGIGTRKENKKEVI